MINLFKNINFYYSIISILLIVFLASLSLRKEGRLIYMNNDDAAVFPGIIKNNNPDLYPKDIFVSHLNKTYITYYYNLINKLALHANMKKACLTVQLTTRLLFFISVFVLAYSLFKRHEVGWLAMMFYIYPQRLFGHGIAYISALHPAFLALPILIISFAFLIRNKIIVFSVIVTLLFYLHATTAVWGIVLGFFIWLGIKGYKYYKESIIAGIIGIILISPFIWLYLKSGANSLQSIPVSEIKELAFSRLPVHIFPSTWPIKLTFLRFIIFLLIFAFGYIGVRKQEKLKRLLLHIFCGTLFIWFLGIYLSEIDFHPIICKLQLLRSSYIQLIFLTTFLAYFIFSLIKIKIIEEKNYIPLAAIFVGIYYMCQNGLGINQLYGLLAFFISFFLCYNKIVNHYIEKCIKHIVFIILKHKIFLNYFSKIFLILIFVCILFFSYKCIKNYCINSSTIPKELLNAAQWAQQNTSIDSLFITPPSGVSNGFRLWSERSQIPAWKDGGIALYDSSFSNYFLDIMKAYGFSPGMDGKIFQQVTPSQIVKAGIEFNADYALVNSGENIFPNNKVVYKNKKWKIIYLH